MASSMHVRAVDIKSGAGYIDPAGPEMSPDINSADLHSWYPQLLLYLALLFISLQRQLAGETTITCLRGICG